MYVPGIYKNFDELVTINNKLFDYVIDFNIRDEECIEFIENKLIYLNQQKILNEEILLNTITSIHCLQPFCDGNSRTLKIYMYEYLLKYKKKLELQKRSIIIPIFYTPYDKCTTNDIENFKNHIKN